MHICDAVSILGDTHAPATCFRIPPSSYGRIGAEKRKAEAERIRQKYPDRIPVSGNVPFSRVENYSVMMEQDSLSQSYGSRADASSSQVICEKAEKSDIPTIDKKKYLVPAVRLIVYTRYIRLMLLPGLDSGTVCLCDQVGAPPFLHQTLRAKRC